MRRFMDSGELGFSGYPKWDWGFDSVVTTNPFGVSSRVMHLGFHQNARKQLSANQKWWAKWWCRYTYLPGYNRVFRWMSGGTVQVQLNCDSYGRATIINGNGDTLATSDSGKFVLTSWTCFELYVKVHASAGEVELRCEPWGTIASATGVCTDVAGTGTAEAFELYSYTDDGWFHNVIVNDDQGTRNNSWIGGERIYVILPNANGSNNGGTPSTGTDRYAVVDENPANGDTDYIALQTPDDVVTVNLQDLTAPGGITAVQACLNVKRTDAGLREIAPALVNGGPVQVGATITPGVTYAERNQIFETDPTTGNPWLSVANLEVGAKVIT